MMAERGPATGRLDRWRRPAPASRARSVALLRPRQDRRIVLQRTRRRVQIRDRGQHDLIDREAILAGLDPDGLWPVGGEVDDRPERVNPQAVVLPAPPGNPASAAVFEVDVGRRRRSDPPDRGAVRVHATANWTNTESFAQLLLSAFPRIQMR